MDIRLTTLVTLLLTSMVCGAQERIIGDFAQGLQGWEERSFEGNTNYRIIEDNGHKVLKAHADGSASALYWRETIDLEKTPYLHWRWRVEDTFEGIDERTKAGDDYPARIYVVVRGGLAFWRTYAVNYVWSSNQPIGTQWPNAYAGNNVQMLALDSGTEKVGEWVTHVRDVRADFKNALGREVDSIDGVALMTDADDTGESVRAWYGNIWFSDSPKAPATEMRGRK